ncbi:MAG: hypothetical protein V1914_02060 [archaeon]
MNRLEIMAANIWEEAVRQLKAEHAGIPFDKTYLILRNPENYPHMPLREEITERYRSIIDDLKETTQYKK